MKLIWILSTFLATTSCGVVDYTRCGGSGSSWQLRVTDCEGPLCYMRAGTPYPIQWDMTPSIPIASLRLKVSAIYMGLQVTIINAVLDNSSVQPGTTYTIQYTLTPYEVACRNTMRVSAELFNAANDVGEVCVAYQVHVTCDEEEAGTTHAGRY
ncbi:uncharacterized protein LOC110856587 [Folsomia candida]|uniref:Mite group 2 allergen Pso o 2 n=1 Tax=Folsomia candida TaxID=158441 RepID=A0A226DLD0_FOLCA|nr:uncharacterized protein LOC110856587 [Folsomia candida]XP_035713105.1 uncharacterized protein LOC110856587 [Folsomia candida]OXA45999.1 Mite group 2 allergen Pso o 2 [Folsomia candida]